MPETAHDLATEIRDLLVARRYFWASEYELQAGIGSVLETAGYDVDAEHHLGAAGRIDFLVAGRVGVEVKVKGALPPLIRQLYGYAKDARIGALVVASTRAVHRGVPDEIAGVPVVVAPLVGDLL